ncbi:small membrane A-kinase anchor protein isoform 1-T3 [Megaptera novaeangliae]
MLSQLYYGSPAFYSWPSLPPLPGTPARTSHHCDMGKPRISDELKTINTTCEDWQKGTLISEVAWRGKALLNIKWTNAWCLFSKDAVEVVFATAFLHSVKALHNMGCMKSKQTFPFPTTLESEKRHESEENFMPEERFLLRMPSLVNVKEEVKEPLGPEIVVFEFAHRLSQEILSDALQQWAGNHLKYYDIPYIESEGP